METLVSIRFRHRNEVAESLWQWLVQIRNDRVHTPAILLALSTFRVEYDADGKQVVDLIDRLALARHLPIDGADILRPTVHIELETVAFETLLERPDERLDVPFPFVTGVLQTFHDRSVFVRVEDLER